MFTIHRLNRFEIFPRNSLFSGKISLSRAPFRYSFPSPRVQGCIMHRSHSYIRVHLIDSLLASFFFLPFFFEISGFRFKGEELEEFTHGASDSFIGSSLRYRSSSQHSISHRSGFFFLFSFPFHLTSFWMCKVKYSDWFYRYSFSIEFTLLLVFEFHPRMLVLVLCIGMILIECHHSQAGLV